MHRTAVVGVAPPAPAPLAADVHACPGSKQLRERLRGLAAECVASWRADAAAPRSAAGLREQAERLVDRASAPREVVGWTMVALVSEYWRDRLAAVPAGRRLVLLPDCPLAADGPDTGVPHVCGPACGIAAIWAAARDRGWVVESTSQAVAAIGALVTGQYEGVLGVARLPDLEKAFAMLPAFALPIAAVPFRKAGSAAGTCGEALAASALDVDWVLGLLGAPGAAAATAGDSLPLLREAAALFEPASLGELADRLGLPGALGTGAADPSAWPPLAAAAEMAGDFVSRGGKFLRPFVTLAAFDAVVADQAGRERSAGAGPVDPRGARTSVRAAAVAIEIFHKASLVHDDIEDADAVRYGRATLHEEVGVPSAINAGDYLLGIGYRIMAGLPGLDSGTIRDAVAILADAHVRLARGQGAELWWRDARSADAATRRLTPDEALAIYGLKTSPAFEAAVALGVRLAGADPRAVAALDRYALHVGRGFQVLNDLKDWNGDLENDRRQAGDLLGGRPTLLWALALEGLSAPDRATLLDVAAAARRVGGTAAPLAEARRLYERAEVVPRATRIAAEERRLAGEAIASCRLPRLRTVLEFLLDLAVPAGWTPQG